jgi:hypothetical protein
MLQCLTGLTSEGFIALVPAFEVAYKAAVATRDAQRNTPRQREHGAGQKGALPEVADQWVFILCYFRLYPVPMAHGFFFGMGQPQANAWIHRLRPVLHAALGYDLQLPAGTPSDIKAGLETCPGLDFIIDGTQRPIRRPQDKARQKATDSGKKKRHPVKNNGITDQATGQIEGLRPTGEGNRHDKKLAEEQPVAFPEGSKLWKDTGFQGYEPDPTEPFQPTQKPKGSELSPEEKSRNTALSQARIAIEHTRGGVKVFRMLHDVFPTVRAGFDDRGIAIAGGLHNFRLDHPLAA